MESDVDEKIFPEGANELRRTGNIIERRARRNLRAAGRQFSFHKSRPFFIARKNVLIKSNILNCRCTKHLTFDKNFL